MTAATGRQRAITWSAGLLGVTSAAYVAWVGKAWYSYGRPPAPCPGDTDSLLDSVMPEYEVAERHRVYVAAPADITFRAACDADMQGPLLVRGIFKAREWLLGTRPDATTRPTGLLGLVQSLGWRVLAESAGREVVLGAVTQPWNADVVFRGLSADEFRAFQEPGFAKIVWTLRVKPLGTSASILRTETRVVTTDGSARRRFRWYWARFSPGIVLIRYALLRSVKQDAERRERLARSNDDAIRRHGPRVGTSPTELR